MLRNIVFTLAALLPLTCLGDEKPTEKPTEEIEIDELVEFRKKLIGTKWRWDERGRKTTLEFKEFNRCVRKAGSRSVRGTWVLVDKQTAIMGFGHLYILNFDARYTVFTVRTSVRTCLSGTLILRTYGRPSSNPCHQTGNSRPW